MSYRRDRVADVVLRELNELLRRELRDPRVGLATISRVELSPDLRYAQIAVSRLGPEEEREDCVRVLQRAAGFLRRQLATRLRLRNVPELRFRLDRGAEHSQRISDLLDELHDDSS